jgi:hypothetical protein
MYDPNISIALNVSRARLTVIGFMLTIDIFALGIFLSSREHQVSLKIISDLSVFYALVASLCVGTVAALLMLVSERFDPQGNSDVGIFGIAEMTMFVAIVQTISGISSGFIAIFQQNLGEPAFSTLGIPGTGELIAASESFRGMVFWLISLCWIFIVYIAPFWSLSRMPCKPLRKIFFAVYYLALTAVAFMLSAYAMDIEMLAHGESSGVGRLFLLNFWAPGLWDPPLAPL